jgi:serine/threonine protein kinase
MPQVDEWVSDNFPGAEFIHEGGQRRVYHVSQPEPSALKIWPVSQSSQHERHVREVSALGRLRHEGLPRVVAHLSQVEICGRLYATYQEEWLEAPSLMKQLAELPLEPESFKILARTAIETLVHLHDEHIVHRDISLGNVLWDGERAYIIDLGLAKHLDLDSITRTGEGVGMTRLTASPEQLQGVTSDLRPSIDVYSLGIVLVVAATGSHPFLENDEELPIPQYVSRQTARDFRVDIPLSVETGRSPRETAGHGHLLLLDNNESRLHPSLWVRSRVHKYQPGKRPAQRALPRRSIRPSCAVPNKFPTSKRGRARFTLDRG